MSEENRKRPLEDAEDGEPKRKISKEEMGENAKKGLKEAMDSLEDNKRFVTRLANEKVIETGRVPEMSRILEVAKPLISFFYSCETGLNSGMYFSNPAATDQELALSVFESKNRSESGRALFGLMEIYTDETRWREFVKQVEITENARLPSRVSNGRIQIFYGETKYHQKKSVRVENFVDFWPGVSSGPIAPVFVYFDKRRK